MVDDDRKCSVKGTERPTSGSAHILDFTTRTDVPESVSFLDWPSFESSCKTNWPSKDKSGRALVLKSSADALTGDDAIASGLLATLETANYKDFPNLNGVPCRQRCTGLMQWMKRKLADGRLDSDVDWSADTCFALCADDSSR